MLIDAGYSVFTANSALDAIQILESQSVTAAILDIRMDDSDEDNIEGFLLAAEIRNKWPNIKVVVLTGYGSVETVRAAFKNYNVQKWEIEKLLVSLNTLFPKLRS